MNLSIQRHLLLSHLFQTEKKLFHPQTRTLLAELLEIPPAYVDDVMQNDVHMTWVNNNYAMEGIVHEHDGQSHVDLWGIEWTKQGPYNQVTHFPLGRASPEEVRRYRFPLEHKEFLLGLMDPVVATAEEYFIGCDVSPCVFEMYWRLRGLERTLLEMAEEAARADVLIAYVPEASMGTAVEIWEAYRAGKPILTI